MRRIIRKFAQNIQTNKHTNRDFKYRGHSYPLWIAGGSGPIFREALNHFLIEIENAIISDNILMWG